MDKPLEQMTDQELCAEMKETAEWIDKRWEDIPAGIGEMLLEAARRIQERDEALAHHGCDVFTFDGPLPGAGVADSLPLRPMDQP